MGTDNLIPVERPNVVSGTAIRHMAPEGTLSSDQKDGLSGATHELGGSGPVPAGGWEGPYRRDLGQGFVTNSSGEEFWVGPGADLSGRDLSGIQAPNADFSGALINGCRGREANLREARFDGARVHDLHLVRSSLAGSQWGGTEVSKLRVHDSDMSGIVATTFRWDDVVISGTPCDGMRLSQGELNRFTVENSSLADVGLHQLRVSHGGLFDCHAQGLRVEKSTVSRFRIAGTDARQGEWNSVETQDIEVFASQLEGSTFHRMLGSEGGWMVDEFTTYDSLPGKEVIERPDLLENLKRGDVTGHLVSNKAILPPSFDWEGRSDDFHVPEWELRKG